MNRASEYNHYLQQQEQLNQINNNLANQNNQPVYPNYQQAMPAFNQMQRTAGDDFLFVLIVTGIVLGIYKLTLMTIAGIKKLHASYKNRKALKNVTSDNNI